MVRLDIVFSSKVEFLWLNFKCFQWFFILLLFFHEKFMLKRDLEEALFDEGRLYSDKFERTP